MNYKKIEHELRIQYYKHKRALSDPFELLDLVEMKQLNDQEKKQVIALADALYFRYDHDLNDHDFSRSNKRPNRDTK